MAIAFDAAAHIGNIDATGASSLTWSHTCSGSDRVLIVGVSGRSAFTVSGVTYNGVAMTAIRSDSDTSNDKAHTQLWRLVAPATGANNVVVSFSSASNRQWAGSVSLTGVHQTTPEDANAGYGSDSDDAPTANITTTVDQSWGVDVTAHIAATFGSADSGQTTRNLSSNSDFLVGEMSTEGPDGTGAQTMGTNGWSSAANCCMSADFVQVAGGGAATTRGMPFGARGTAFNGGRTFMGNLR